MSISNDTYNRIRRFETLIGSRVRGNLNYKVKGVFGQEYDAFTLENLKEIEKYVASRIQFFLSLPRIEERCASIMNAERFVQLVAGERLKDGTFSGLSKIIYDKSSTNSLATDSYYHFSPEEYRYMFFTDLIDNALIKESKER